jgi:hypothetical protein
MRDNRLALPIVLAVVALAAGGCDDDESSATAETAATEASPRDLAKLIGTVGSTDDPNAYEISLTTEDGSEVTTTLPPGKYRLETKDLSTIHNFHLGGPRAAVEVATDVAGRGEKTAIVVLQEGESYSYVCDAHPVTMSVTFSIHGRIRTQN